MPRLCTSRHPTHQAGRLAAVRTARRCVGLCVGPRCMRRACWAGLASGRLRLGHGAHLARHARKTGGLDAVVPGSPRRSSFSCEACGALRRAAVESLICQLLYNYSSSSLAKDGSMIVMRMRCAGRACLRVAISQKKRPGPFARSADAGAPWVTTCEPASGTFARRAGTSTVVAAPGLRGGVGQADGPDVGREEERRLESARGGVG